MPASNFPFKTDGKIQEFAVPGSDKKEKWLICVPNDDAHTTEKQRAYNFTADQDMRETQLIFDYGIPLIHNGDPYLLCVIQGSIQQMIEIRPLKKVDEKWALDQDKYDALMKDWGSTGYLTAFKLKGVWNAEILIKLAAERKVMLRHAIKVLFSKSAIPQSMIEKTTAQYSVALDDLLSGKEMRKVDPDVMRTLKELNVALGLPEIAMSALDLCDDLGDSNLHPSYKGEFPNQIEPLFRPSVETKPEYNAKKSFGMSPEARMDFVLNNFDNKRIASYTQKILASPDGYLRHLILMQMTGLAVGFPSGLVSNAILPFYASDQKPVDPADHTPAVEELISDTTVEIQQEDPLDLMELIDKASLAPKDRAKTKECIDWINEWSPVPVDLAAWVRYILIDISTIKKASRTAVVVLRELTVLIQRMYKLLSSKIVKEQTSQFVAYIERKYGEHQSIETLNVEDFNALCADMADLNKKSAVEIIDLNTR